MSDDKFYTVKPNEPVGVLKLNESLSVYVYKKMPNRFHRWIVRLLLGWVYEQYKQGDKE